MSAQHLAQLIDDLPGAQRLTTSAVDSLLIAIEQCAHEQQVESVVRIAQRFPGRFHWQLYRESEDEIRQGMTVEEVNDNRERELAEKKAAEEARWQQAMAERQERMERILAKGQTIQQKTRKCELELGACETLLNEILSPFDPVEIEGTTLRAILPNELFPAQYYHERTFTYDHEIHRLVETVLELIGPEGRGDRRVIHACGSVVATLFPEEDDSREQCLTFQECLARAETFVARNPRDPFALIWRSELAIWLDDRDAAFEYADLAWKESERCGANEIANIIWLLGNLTGLTCEVYCRDELGWSAPYSCPSWWHVCDLKSSWLEEEECFTAAIVRRAIQQARWDTELLAAFQDIICNGMGELLLSADLLPPSCWVWITEQPNDDFVEGYYGAWTAAYYAAKTQPNCEPVLFAACVVLLAGWFLERNYWSNEPKIPSILKTLQELSSRKELNQHVARVIWLSCNAFRDQQPTHLTAADKLALQEALRWHSSSCSETDNLVGGKASVIEEQRRRLATKRDLRNKFGEELWDKLASKTQLYLLEGELRLRQEGYDIDYGPGVVLQFSHAVLWEANDKFWQYVYADNLAVAELKAFHLHADKNLEWPIFIKVLNLHEKLTRVNGIAARRRVYTDALAHETEAMAEMCTSGRNRAAHRELIDRNAALKLYRLWIEEGACRRILGALNGKILKDWGFADPT